MFKHFTSIFILLLCFTACNDHVKRAEVANINLTLENGASQKIIIERIDPTEIVVVDSVVCDKNGAVLIRLFPKSQEMYLLRFIDHSFIPLIVQKNSSTNISANFNNIGETFFISEGIESKQITRYFRRLFHDQRISDSLAMVLNRAATSDFEKTRTELYNLYNNLYDNHKIFAEDLIHNNPSALSNLFILNQNIGQQRIFDIQNDSSLFFLVDDSLLCTFPQNEHVLKNHERIGQFRTSIIVKELAKQRLNPGNKAPDLLLTDINGTNHSLNALSGKTVLIAFWASWDGNFKNDIQILKILYNDYKKKGFEIMAISMDEKEEFWKNAVKAQKAPWINASDLKNVHSPLIKMYNLDENLPIYYLIDEKGIIIAQDPTLIELDNLLYEKYK